MRRRRMGLPAIGVAAALLAMGCESPEEALPGTYVGTLDSNVSAARVANQRPDGAGGTVADVTHYSRSNSASGVHVVVRRTGSTDGHTTFTATVGKVCEVPLQLLDNGSISNLVLPAHCRCDLDGTWVKGNATVSGRFAGGRLNLEIDVSFMGSKDHTGGCSHTFVSGP